MKLSLALAAASFLLVACGAAPAPPEVPAAAAAAAAAGPDAHGCQPAAGMAWCEREAKCISPLEVAKTLGVPVSPDMEANKRALETYCAAKK